MIKLSVVIITFNEEKNILRCLQSVKKVADEIIVLDSHSTDDTLAVAIGEGASVSVGLAVSVAVVTRWQP